MKSNLATYTRLTKNHSGKRTSPVKHIVIHHMAGVMTGKQCADYFATTTRQVSSNYCIGYNGDIACSVLEENRAWTSSSAWIDQKAITIEVSNSSYGGQWLVSNASLNATIKLIADICKRHGIKECTYTGDKSGTLHKHSWYWDTNCPGPYLGSKFDYIASEVNKLLERDMNKASATSTKGVYVVKHGDSLWSIAEAQLGDGKRWSEIKTLNKLNSNVIYASQTLKLPESKPKLLSLQEIAKEVIAGKKWGNGAERRNRLTQAGYDYNAVQAEVNRQLAAPASKSKPLVVGSKVKIKKTATDYATGQKIPFWVKGRTDTVIQIKTDRVLLKNIYSWVYTKDIEVL